MASPTAVNSQITDAVTQANISTQGNTPATAMGSLMIALAQAMANAAHNAANAQQQNNITAQAVTTACVTKLLSIGRSGANAQVQTAPVQSKSTSTNK